MKLEKLQPPLQLAARRGGRYPGWAPTGSVGAARRLRCGARSERAAAMPLAAALNAPPLHGFSPVRRLRRRTSPCAAPLLAAPQVAHTGYRPPRSNTAVFVDEYLGAAGKAVGGCASAATLCGAEERRARGRARTRALQHLTRRDCSSATNEVSEASFSAGHETEHLKGVVAKATTAVHERCRIPARGFARSLPQEKQR